MNSCSANSGHSKNTLLSPFQSPVPRPDPAAPDCGDFWRHLVSMGEIRFHWLHGGSYLLPAEWDTESRGTESAPRDPTPEPHCEGLSVVCKQDPSVHYGFPQGAFSGDTDSSGDVPMIWRQVRGHPNQSSPWHRIGHHVQLRAGLGGALFQGSVRDNDR